MLGKTINGEMVLLARKRRRKTQSELAAETGIPQTSISRIENGTDQSLTPDQVKALIRVLRFPASFFYEQEQLYRQPISLHAAAFRKRASVSAKDAETVVALGNHYVIQLRKMFDALELESEFPLLQFEVVSAKDGAGDHARAVPSASEAAAAVRACWQIGTAPIPSLTRFIEATGIAVLHADFGSADIDGFTLRPVGMRPVIFLNSSRPADRMRFSLAHEFAHAVLHAFPYEAMEKEANEFAAELLMPALAIRPELKKGMSIPDLGKLKLRWGVSIASLVYRAKSLGVIDSEQARSMWMALQPYRKSEPEQYDVPKEEPKLVDDVIKIHLSELGLGTIELANGVSTFPDEFASMYGLHPSSPEPSQRPKLRIVSRN